jgi:excisionase family DNA binding protein
MTTTSDSTRHLTTPARQRMLTPADVAEQLCVSIRTVWRMVERGDIPPPIRWSRKLVRWHAEAIERYLAELLDGEPSLPC